MGFFDAIVGAILKHATLKDVKKDKEFMKEYAARDAEIKRLDKEIAEAIDQLSGKGKKISKNCDTKKNF